MKCEPIDLGNGVAGFVCGRGRDRRPKCSWQGCQRPSRYQCDFPIVEAETCDRHLCAEHRHRQGKGVDYCPEHEDERVAALVDGPLFARGSEAAG